MEQLIRLIGLSDLIRPAGLCSNPVIIKMTNSICYQEWKEVMLQMLRSNL